MSPDKQQAELVAAVKLFQMVADNGSASSCVATLPILNSCEQWFERLPTVADLRLVLAALARYTPEKRKPKGRKSCPRK